MARSRRRRTVPTEADQATMRLVSEHIEGVIGRIGDAVRPIYETGPDGSPALVGSSVPFRFDTYSFLVTAAHVMDFRSEKNELFAAGASMMVPLSGDYLATPAPLSVRDKDRVDLAVIPLSAEQVTRFGPVPYLGPDDLGTAETVDPSPLVGTRYLALGFVRSRQPKLDGNELEPLRQSAALEPRPVTDYAVQGLDPKHHILFEFRRDEMLGPQGTWTAAVPHGMSGGGIWTLDPLNRRPSERNRIVSIFIEYHRAPLHTITSTRVGVFLEAISNTFPALRPILERPPKRY
jgi:hypothetical protein